MVFDTHSNQVLSEICGIIDLFNGRHTVLQAHSGRIEHVSAVDTDNDTHLLLTVGADRLIKLWCIQESAVPKLKGQLASVKLDLKLVSVGFW